MPQKLFCQKLVPLGVLFAFLINTLGANIPSAQADEFVLPKAGVRVHLSPPMNPAMLKGIKVHPNNPFQFDFILDQGDIVARKGQDTLKEEANRLIKYFLASLTIPEHDLWVNLSPYEKDRIIPESFGLTEMGRDLLAEDYMLKQITASLIYPEDEIGKKFWRRVYQEASARYGTTNIPVNTFNKVWIVPEKAVVYENAKAGTAYVVESKLKVMLEEDYLAKARNQEAGQDSLGNQIIREIVLPELSKEVNENQNFAQLRQVYNSLILATWYKKKIKDSILSQVYADKNKTAGINIDDPQQKEKIYQQYLQAFKKGVYNYIKEEQDPITQQAIPRKYFSGGVQLQFGREADKAMVTTDRFPAGQIVSTSHVAVSVQIDAAMLTDPLVGRLYQALEKNLDRNRSFWKADPRLKFPYNPSAPTVAYDPQSILNRPIGIFSQIGVADDIFNQDIPQIASKVPGEEGVALSHELKNILMDDPQSSGLVVVPNRYPLDSHHALVITRELKPQLETGEFLSSALHWANRGVIVEYHRRLNVVSHYHFQLFDPPSTPIFHYRESFQPEVQSQGVELGTLAAYPVPHFAIASSDMEQLKAATITMQHILESRNILFTRDILRNDQGKLIVLFFIFSGQFYGFRFNTLGYVRSDNPNLTLTDVQEGLRKAFVPKEFQDRLKDELWSQWSKSTPGDKAMAVDRGAIGQVSLTRKVENIKGNHEDAAMMTDGQVRKFINDVRDVFEQKIDQVKDLNQNVPQILAYNLTDAIAEILGRPGFNKFQRQLVLQLNQHFKIEGDLNFYFYPDLKSSEGIFVFELSASHPEQRNITWKLDSLEEARKIIKVAEDIMDGLNIDEDKAMIGEKGGIDFTANKTPLEIQHAGGGIEFDLDPVMLQRFQSAPGFYPVIIGITPLNDLRNFLGITTNPAVSTV